MEPEYQRQGGVWSEEDESFLIDSIINDYDIPKLYLADFTSIATKLNEDKKRYAVIDGKQRLEALFRFFNNEYPLATNTTWVDNPKTQISGLFYSDLQASHADLASKIAEFPLPIMHVITDEVERINQLFVRLNKGSSLTGAEKRNAMLGPVPKVIRRLSEHVFFKEYVRYKAKRGQNLNAAAKLLRFELARKPVDTKKIQLDEMVNSHETLKPKELERASDKVNRTLGAMCGVFHKKDPLLANQGSLAVYYLFAQRVGRDNVNMRQFLVSFERELRATRRISEDRRPNDLVLYDNAARSTNDGGSYDIRLKTLLDRYAAYRASEARVAP
jgi:hypothetical protein